MNLIQRLWCEALLSGKYKQGFGTLLSAPVNYVDNEGEAEPDLEGASYCVLGVLCDIHRQMTGKGKWVWASSVPPRERPQGTQTSWGYATLGDGFIVSILPTVVEVWSELAGINEKSSLPTGYFSSQLSRLNDSGIDFPFLAGFIQRKLGGFL